MNVLEILADCPLVASVQSSPGAHAGDPETLARIAQDHVENGIRLLRLEGIDSIKAVQSRLNTPFIGLIKRRYGDVNITATLLEVDQLQEVGAPIVAFDATGRQTSPGDIVRRIHQGGALAMADCDRLETVQAALAVGADFIGTTLAGYVVPTKSQGPDLDFLKQAIATGANVLAEGRYATPEQAQLALRLGAKGVVIGGALNDPIKLTHKFLATMPAKGTVGAIDIGGTWLRFATFTPDWKLQTQEKIELPLDPKERLNWIRERAQRVDRLGISTGGVVDPVSGIVVEAKPLIPGHVGSEFSQTTLGRPTQALNDGLATAWGHACLPAFAGQRVATLALGTGVGCGFVADHRLGPSSMDYMRLNDLPISGSTFEELLGGAALSPNPDQGAKTRAIEAARQALQILEAMLRPEIIVLAGGVGLAPWLLEALKNEPKVVPSPFGEDAGLYGAAALALFPPVF